MLSGSAPSPMRRGSSRDRSAVRRWGVRLVTVGGVVVVIAMFGPWVRSGANNRNSFELVELVDRLGFTPNGPVETAIRGWPLAPLLVVIAVVLTIWRRGRAGAIAAIVVGAAVGAVGIAMRTVPESALIGGGWGSAVDAVGGLLMVAGGTAILVSRRMSAAPDPARLEDAS
jgi:hypothetical protein